MVVLTRDPLVRQVVDSFSTAGDCRVDLVETPSELFSVITPETSLLVLDEAACGSTGYVAAIKRARKSSPAIDAVVIGGPKSDDVLQNERVEAVDQYHGRPLDGPLFEASIRHRMRIASLKKLGGIVGRSPAMEEIIELILQVAPTDVPILMEGESGTGKDVLARAIHLASRRRERSFEAINCGSLAEGVLESELFGHERGAFTGAVSRRAGMFERANQGTIFLDEVGETSPNMQVRLLRVLESGEFLRVGGVETLRVEVRVIAATNRNLHEAVRRGAFRQDLYYRLKGVSFVLPPLRRRKEDIPILVQHFMTLSNHRHHKSVRGVDQAAMRRLIDYPWPGNIRELRNTVDTLVVLSQGSRITEDVVEAQLKDATGTPYDGAQPTLLPVALHRTREEAEREMIYASILALHRDVREVLSILRGQKGPGLWEGLKEVKAEADEGEADEYSLAQMERAAIREALNRYSGNRRKSAEALGISERTLYRKIREYGLM